MTNLDNMKNTLSSEILNLNEQQLYNLFLLLEGESDVPERFGIDSSKYYTCQKCRKEHNGCIIVVFHAEFNRNNFPVSCKLTYYIQRLISRNKWHLISPFSCLILIGFIIIN